MKKIGCSLATLLCLGLFGAFFITGIPGRNYWRAKKLSATIAQQLPLGSSKSQVMSFLKKEHVEHSYNDENLDIESVVEDANLKPSQLGGIVHSIVRETSWGFIYTADTQFVFFFDKNDRLIKLLRQDVATAP